MLWRESIACNNVLLTVQSTVSCRHEYHLQNTGCIVIIYGCCHLTVDGQYNSSPIWLKPHRTLWNKTKTKHWNSLKQFTACFGLISLFIRYQLRHLRSIRRSVNDDANVLSCARVHRKSRWLLQRCPAKVTDCTTRCCSNDHWRSSKWAHHCDTVWVWHITLDAGATAHTVYSCSAGVQ